MKQLVAVCSLLVITCSLNLSVLPVVAQDTFKNPAMEPQDDFQRAFNAARRLAREGKGEDAIKEVKKAAKLRNDQCAECFQLMAQIYFQMAKYKDAAAAFRQAIALKPDNEAGLYNSLGVALMRVVTPVVSASIEYAVPLDPQIGDDPTGRFHINFGFVVN